MSPSVSFSGNKSFMAKCRLLDCSTTSQTWLVWPVIMQLTNLYPSMTSSAMVHHSPTQHSPIFLKMNIPLQFYAGLIDLELATLQNLDDARRLRIDFGAGRLVGGRDADHLGIAAQIHVRRRRIERLAEFLFELAAGDQILNVDLV